jgi:hypothetical protein
MMAQKKVVGDDMHNWIMGRVSDLAWERAPNARGYTGLMKKIAREEFGVRLTQDIENDCWGDDIYVVNEQQFLMAQLKY